MMTMSQLAELFSKFIHDYEDYKGPYIIKFEMLTPDACIYAIKTNKKFYVIHQEDFCPKLELVKETIEDWFVCDVKKFLKPVKPLDDQLDYHKGFAIYDRDYIFIAEVKPTKGHKTYWTS